MIARVRAALPAVAVLAALAPLPARADDKSEIAALVRRYTSAFNAGDRAALDATGAATQAVIDEFPPYAWDGPNAIDGWYRGLAKISQSSGVTGRVTLRTNPPAFVEVESGRAWATVPSVVTYTIKGVTTSEHGSLAFAFQKLAAGWRIRGFAWSRTS